MKYPLDTQAIEEMSKDILLHHRGQQQTIDKLTHMCSDLLEEAENMDEEEKKYAFEFLASLGRRKVDFENHRFNQKNGHGIGVRSPFEADLTERIITIDLKKEADLNAMEAEHFGGEMSEEEIERLFNIEESKKKKPKQKKLSKMTLEEIEAWEKAQDNANDIYKVSARVKNLARGAVKGNLTAQGDMVVNMFTHVIKSLYDFADTVSDKETKIKLTDLIRRQEEMPANLIAALGAGVKTK